MALGRLKAVVCTYEISPQAVASLLAQIGKVTDVEISGVIIDNGKHPGPSQLGPWQIHAGSNTLMDFSAYAEGAAIIDPVLGQADEVLFLNDTVFTRHNASFHLTRLIRYREVVRATVGPCIVGKTDDYTNICYANPWNGMNVYVSSFAFLLNTAGLHKLLQVYRSMDEIMGSLHTEMSSETWAPNLDRRFREFLRMHLAQGESPTSWYQAKKYANHPIILQKKARCVYLEHKLSGEIGRDGIIVSMYPRSRDKFVFSMAEKTRKIRRSLPF